MAACGPLVANYKDFYSLFLKDDDTYCALIVKEGRKGLFLFFLQRQSKSTESQCPHHLCHLYPFLLTVFSPLNYSQELICMGAAGPASSLLWIFFLLSIFMCACLCVWCALCLLCKPVGVCVHVHLAVCRGPGVDVGTHPQWCFYLILLRQGLSVKSRVQWND